MEPLTTAAMIGGIVSFLGTKLSKDKSINNFFSEFSEATVHWIKPLFLEDDGTEKEIIKNLKDKPASAARKKAVESAFEMALEDDKSAEEHIKEMFEKVSTTEDGGKIINNIINSKNVNTGNVNTNGGDFKIGDSK